MSALRDLLEKARAEGLFTHAALAVFRDGVLVVEEAAGGSAATVFDVASLTKVFTATLAVDTLPLDRRLEWLDGAPTVGDLLAHRAGLPAWRPLFAMAADSLRTPLSALCLDPLLQRRAHESYRRALTQTKAEAARPTYSDLGFLALGFALEEEHATTLPELARERLLEPAGLHATRWGGQMAGAPPTGDTRPRKWLPSHPEAETLEPGPALDRGVDDDNAAALGGASGHAGVWSTAHDVARLGELLRTTGASDARRSALFLKAGGGRTFGLDTPTGEASSIGSLLGRGPFGAAGHLGFTGCSLWIDRDAKLSIALLSNAVLCERPAVRFRAWRRELHDGVAREVA